jgi:hypothetical protein
MKLETNGFIEFKPITTANDISSVDLTTINALFQTPAGTSYTIEVSNDGTT